MGWAIVNATLNELWPPYFHLHRRLHRASDINVRNTTRDYVLRARRGAARFSPNGIERLFTERDTYSAACSVFIKQLSVRLDSYAYLRRGILTLYNLDIICIHRIPFHEASRDDSVTYSGIRDKFYEQQKTRKPSYNLWAQ